MAGKRVIWESLIVYHGINICVACAVVWVGGCRANSAAEKAVAVLRKEMDTKIKVLEKSAVRVASPAPAAGAPKAPGGFRERLTASDFCFHEQSKRVSFFGRMFCPGDSTPWGQYVFGSSEGVILKGLEGLTYIQPALSGPVASVASPFDFGQSAAGRSPRDEGTD